jgi:hypothetical protein
MRARMANIIITQARERKPGPGIARPPPPLLAPWTKVSNLGMIQKADPDPRLATQHTHWAAKGWQLPLGVGRAPRSRI